MEATNETGTNPAGAQSSATGATLSGGLEVFTRPLPEGALIEYCGQRGTVINDDGGERIEVTCDGHRQKWYWKFEGESCTVISMTSNNLLTSFSR